MRPLTITSFLIVACFVACAGAENNAGHVLENANSVVKSGSEKIWIGNNSEAGTGKSAEGEDSHKKEAKPCCN